MTEIIGANEAMPLPLPMKEGGSDIDRGISIDLPS